MALKFNKKGVILKRELGKYCGEVRYFSAKVKSLDKFKLNILLTDVSTVTGTTNDAHVWIKYTSKLEDAIGKVITFRAEVVEYDRLSDDTTDYTLDKVRDLKII